MVKSGLVCWSVEDVPREIIEEYSSGKCMWFAVALHRILGWDIRATIEIDTIVGRSYLGHAWVESPTRERLDIAGPKGPEDFLQWGDPVVRFTEEEFARFLGGINEAEVERARRIALSLAQVSAGANVPYFEAATCQTGEL